jgi:hypothetical protein
MVVPELVLVSLEPCAVGAELPEAPPLCGVTPVVPMGPPEGLCCPAAVAGLAGAVVGGLPWANAAPAAPRANAAMSLEVLFMVVSPEGKPAMPEKEAVPDRMPDFRKARLSPAPPGQFAARHGVGETGNTRVPKDDRHTRSTNEARMKHE